MDHLQGSDSEDGLFEHSLSDVEENMPDFEEELEEEGREEDEVPAAAAPRILPYQYEPVFRVGEVEVDDNVVGVRENEEDVEGRLGNNHWCSCSGGCSPMPKVVESICCKEVPQVTQTMDAYEPEELDCITDHPGFRSVCLDRWVLETAYYQYRQQYGQQARQDATENEKNRHVAYRQLARWCWGYLGRSVRVPLPSCAVTQIRTTFPSSEYRGFEEA